MHNILDEFEFPPDLTTAYGVSCLECRKTSYILIMGKSMSPHSLADFDQILFIIAGNNNIYNNNSNANIGVPWP